jgi:hypothetical protein
VLRAADFRAAVDHIISHTFPSGYAYHSLSPLSCSPSNSPCGPTIRTGPTIALNSYKAGGHPNGLDASECHKVWLYLWSWSSSSSSFFAFALHLGWLYLARKVASDRTSAAFLERSTRHQPTHPTQMHIFTDHLSWYF